MFWHFKCKDIHTTECLWFDPNHSVIKGLYCICLYILGKNGSGSGGASSSADVGINKGRPQSGKGAGPANTCPKVKVRIFLSSVSASI